MASQNSNKLTYFTDDKTVLTASFMNTFYYTQNGLTYMGIPAYGHKHDGQRLDGHAQKINLTTDVDGMLSIENIDGGIFSSIVLSSDGTGAADGDLTIYADNSSGLINLVASDNVALTGDDTLNTVSISAKNTEYSFYATSDEENVAKLYLVTEDLLTEQFIKINGSESLSITVSDGELNLDSVVPTLSDLVEFSAKGDLLSYDGTNFAILPVGTNGKFLKANSAQTSGLEWVTITQNLGDVVGPSSATANAIARYDGITGKLIKDSNVTIDDLGNVIVTIGYVSINIGDIRSATDVTANIFNQNSNINIGNVNTSEQTINVATAAKSGSNKSTVNIGSQSDSSIINLKSYARYHSKLFCGDVKAMASSVTQTVYDSSLNYRYYRYSPLNPGTRITFELGDPALELGRVISIANHGVGHLDIHWAGGIETHANGLTSASTLHIESGEWAEIVSMHNESSVIIWSVLMGGTLPNFAN